MFRAHSKRVLRPFVALVLLLVGAGVSSAQDVVSRTEFEQYPEDAGSLWSRVGSGHALLLDGEMVLNDNSQGSCIAYQALVGQIQADHRVVLEARVRVLSNIGGMAAMVEISRPGAELVVQLHSEQIVVMERAADRELRWLASTPVDLGAPFDLRLTKAAVTEDPAETLTVEVDGQAVLSCRARGLGELGTGRVVFGSLGYPDMGASGWFWVDLAVEQIEVSGVVGVEATSLGSLKGRFAP